MARGHMSTGGALPNQRSLSKGGSTDSAQQLNPKDKWQENEGVMQFFDDIAEDDDEESNSPTNQDSELLRPPNPRFSVNDEKKDED